MGDQRERQQTPVAGAAADRVRIVLRPIGVPLPLALTALATGSFLVAAQELGWLGTGSADSLQLGLVLLGLVFPFQLIAAILGFLARDPVAGTGSALTSGAWLATGVDNVLPNPSDQVLGVSLLAVSISLVVPLANAWLSNRAVFAVLAATGVRFAVAAVYALTGTLWIERVAGGLGIVVMLLSLYTALAFELESMRHRTVLPLLRHGSGRLAMHGDFDEQIRGIEHEAGVRRQI